MLCSQRLARRVAENALKTPVSDKKVKIATPSGQKTGV
jgi:hypothetical protein